MKTLPSDISSEVSRHLHNFSVNPGWTSTTSKDVAKGLLESEWVFCNGRMRDIRAKHLGLGVYKVFTEERP